MAGTDALMKQIGKGKSLPNNLAGLGRFIFELPDGKGPAFFKLDPDAVHFLFSFVSASWSIMELHGGITPNFCANDTLP
jgi:hypothetical protein